MTTIARPDLSTAVRTVKLICVNPAANSNKQWAAWILPSGLLYVEYGRVNYAQKPHSYSCGSVTVAESRLNQLVAEKRAKGYNPVQVEERSHAELDFRKLGSDYADTIREKMQHLATQAETVTCHTAIRFDPSTGLFLTQMGVVSHQTLEQAKVALRQVQTHFTGSSRSDNSRYFNAVSQYLSAIPLPVKMKLEPRQILGDTNQIAQQSQVLQCLDECLSQIDRIRKLIEEAVALGGEVGSDERARWLRWGTTEDAIDPQTPVTGEERACWVRW